MPQGRRKIPFSTKQKKVQLQQKKERKKTHDVDECETEIINERSEHVPRSSTQVLNVNAQPMRGAEGRSTNRYNLYFKKESQEELNRSKEESRMVMSMLGEEVLQVSYQEIYEPGSILDIPKRPPWDYKTSKERLLAMEEKYFREYLDDIERKFGDKSLSYFELNLETWRQLWRVLEMSDVVLMIGDIRHPVLHFSPALYHQVTHEQNKDVIFVLNKIDLAPAPLVLAWKRYFQSNFPRLHVLCFSSFGGSAPKGKRRGMLKMAALGAKKLLNLCRGIAGEAVDLSSWEYKIDEELGGLEDEDADPLAEAKVELVEGDTGHYSAERFSEGTLTLGFVGHPNVGKSSVLNALMGKKVVSVSRTPGHTKHFQTIFLTGNVRLCDCPGLVFPSLVPKPLQILSGCYPVAQIRVPSAVVAFLGQRIDLPRLLKLRHPEEGQSGWSAHDVCSAWALKRGYLTARAGRPDIHRAANQLLRMALDGRTICLCFYPPDFVSNRDSFTTEDPECLEIEQLQGLSRVHRESSSQEEESSSHEEEDDPPNLTTLNKFALLQEM